MEASQRKISQKVCLLSPESLSFRAQRAWRRNPHSVSPGSFQLAFCQLLFQSLLVTNSFQTPTNFRQDAFEFLRFDKLHIEHKKERDRRRGPFPFADHLGAYPLDCLKQSPHYLAISTEVRERTQRRDQHFNASPLYSINVSIKFQETF